MDPLFPALNSKKLSLTRLAIDAINQVKQLIKEAILHVADPNKELTLTTDASPTAIGAILSQEGWPIAFMSKRLIKAQQIWSAAELDAILVEFLQPTLCLFSGWHFLGQFCNLCKTNN